MQKIVPGKLFWNAGDPSLTTKVHVLRWTVVLTSILVAVIKRLHDRANIEQLPRRFMAISMLIRRAGGL